MTPVEILRKARALIEDPARWTPDARSYAKMATVLGATRTRILDASQRPGVSRALAQRGQAMAAVLRGAERAFTANVEHRQIARATEEAELRCAAKIAAFLTTRPAPSRQTLFGHAIAKEASS